MATVKCSVTKSSWYEMYIEYSYTQNQDGCYSDVTHVLKLKQLTNSYDFNGNMNVTYYVNSQWTKVAPSNAGTYQIKVEIPATDKYNSISATKSFTISQK